MAGDAIGFRKTAYDDQIFFEGFVEKIMCLPMSSGQEVLIRFIQNQPDTVNQ